MEWRQAATAVVSRKYGSDFAVPIKTADNKSVVAFASLHATGVQVASDAYELDLPAAQLAVAARTGGRVEHEGRSVAVLDADASLD